MTFETWPPAPVDRRSYGDHEPAETSPEDDYLEAAISDETPLLSKKEIVVVVGLVIMVASVTLISMLALYKFADSRRGEGRPTTQDNVVAALGQLYHATSTPSQINLYTSSADGTVLGPMHGGFTATGTLPNHQPVLCRGQFDLTNRSFWGGELVPNNSTIVCRTTVDNTVIAQLPKRQ